MNSQSLFALLTVAAVGLLSTFTLAGTSAGTSGMPNDATKSQCGCVVCRCPDCNGEVCTCDVCECVGCACKG